MTEIDLNKLERVALAATSGHWIAAGPSFGLSGDPEYLNQVVAVQGEDDDEGLTICICTAVYAGSKQATSDMEYIAAFNPAVAIELIRRLSEAENYLNRWEMYRLEMKDYQARMAKVGASYASLDAYKEAVMSFAVAEGMKHALNRMPLAIDRDMQEKP